MAKDEEGVKNGGLWCFSSSRIAFRCLPSHLTCLIHSTDSQHAHTLLHHMLLYSSRMRIVWMEGFAQQSHLYFPKPNAFVEETHAPSHSSPPPPHHFHRSFSHGPSSEEVGTCSWRGGRGW